MAKKFNYKLLLLGITVIISSITFFFILASKKHSLNSNKSAHETLSRISKILDEIFISQADANEALKKLQQERKTYFENTSQDLSKGMVFNDARIMMDEYYWRKVYEDSDGRTVYQLHLMYIDSKGCFAMSDSPLCELTFIEKKLKKWVFYYDK